MEKSRLISALICGFVVSLHPASASAGIELESFTPEGAGALGATQIKARFSAAMVGFGERSGSRPAPFRWDCALQGQSRWEDPRTWVYDLAEPLPSGLRCTFQGAGAWKAPGGSEWSGVGLARVIDTGPVVVVDVSPSKGSGIEEDQGFVVKFGSAVDANQLAQSLSFVVQGLEERVPITVVTGATRAEVLKQRSWFTTGVKEDRIHVVQARRKFPPEKKVTLEWNAGKTRQTFEYLSQGPFRATMSCSRENERAACVPLQPIQVTFSAEFSCARASGFRLRTADGTREWKTNPDSDAASPGCLTASASFPGPFPESAELVLEVPSDLNDLAGRPLANSKQFPLRFRTAEAPPLFKFPGKFGILEWDGKEAVLPVSLRKIEPGLVAQAAAWSPQAGFPGKVVSLPVENVREWTHWVSMAGQQDALGERRERSLLARPDFPTGGQSTIAIPAVGSQQLEVVGLPIRAPGLYLVEASSPRLSASLVSKNRSMHLSTAVLVTDLAVHFKWGRESSLAWVTRLSTGEPVSGAEVAIRDCNGRTEAAGKTNSQGFVIWRKSLGEPARCTMDPKEEVWGSPLLSGWLVTAKLGTDWTFTSSNWDEGIEPWRYQLPFAKEERGLIVHAVFDRGLYRAGEKVWIKHFLRRHTLRGVESPGALLSRYRFVILQHQGSDEQYVLPLRWDAAGTALNEWSIPNEAKRGYYSVSISERQPTRQARWVDALSTGTIRVEDFKVPFSKGAFALPLAVVEGGDDLAYSLQVDYLNGGPAGGLPVRLIGRLEQGPASAVPSPQGEEWRDFSFSTGPVARDEGEEDSLTDSREVFRKDLVLDSNGFSRLTADVPSLKGKAQKLRLDAEYRDPNGDYRSVSAATALFPASIRAGVRMKNWFQSRGRVPFTIGVVDLKGKPVANQAVEAKWIRNRSFTHRKRIIGGFYAYEYRSLNEDAGVACTGSTNASGLLECVGVRPDSGSFRVEVMARDKQGRADYASASVWIHGEDRADFEPEDNDRIDLIPEKKEYRSGEKAIFQVRMPFARAHALVTVEREGVSRAFVTEIDGAAPRVEVPILPSDAPNAFVSVLAVRGRVAEPPATGRVDLAKPAYRLGIAQIRVDWEPHALKVDVKPDREDYRVRDQVTVDLRVSRPDGQPVPEGAELLVAVVDEGLLELRENTSWKLLEAMMDPRGYEVQTSTAQLQVIGKRHFGLKTRPPGGDGGAPSRELFDTLVFYDPRVRTDDQGRARIRFGLNDSLSGFRVVAVAFSGAHRFGTGSGSFRTRQDLSLFSSLPAVVREGDRFPAELVLRNSSKQPKRVRVTLDSTKIESREVSIGAGASARVGFPWIAGASGHQPLAWSVTDLSSGKVLDRLKASLKILPRIEPRTVQSMLERVESGREWSVPLAMPKGALPGKGGVEVSLSAKIAGSGLEGVKEFMREYPYSCFEQRLSRAIALMDRAAWKKLAAELGTSLDSEGLLRFFPGSGQGSVALTIEALRLLSETGWEIPRVERERMLDGVERFVAGKLPRGYPLPGPENALLRLAGAEALSRYGRLDLTSVSGLGLNASLLPLSSQVDLALLGLRVPLSPLAGLFQAAREAIPAKVVYRGSTLVLERGEAGFGSLASPDAAAARLLLYALQDAKWESDRPKLARALMLRLGRDGSWDTTLANAWGSLAIRRFSERDESSAVTGETVVSLRSRGRSAVWQKSQPQPASLRVDWPEEGNELLRVRQNGGGSPWAYLRAEASIPRVEPEFAGFKIRRKVSGSTTSGGISVVTLEIEADHDLEWVVVREPIAAGASVLGSALGGDSASRSPVATGAAWLAFDERVPGEYRAYYGFVPKGRFQLEYRIRWNQSGEFSLPPTRVEAMYAREIFGELPNAQVQVSEAR